MKHYVLPKNQKQDWDNKGYKYFVCDVVNYDLVENIPWNIISGWEYEEDAKNSILDEPNSKRLKVFSRTYLELLIP
tara:strand:- start:1805 stop:2032 length:228 start_codon:yes stop_codon:yes gene_type:complete